MGCKAAETTHNINNAFGPETAGDKNLEDDECSGWPLEVDSNKLRVVIEADPLTTTWEAAAQFNVNCSMVVWHLKQIGKFTKQVPREPTENKKKNVIFEVWSYYMQQQQNISQSDCDVQWTVDFIWQLVMASSVVGSRSSKAISNTKLAQKNGHGHCLVVCCPSDPLQLSEFQWKLYIWEVWSANQWDAPKTAMSAAGIHQQKGCNSSAWQHSTTRLTTNASKVEQIGLWSFALSAMFTSSLANRLSFFQASWQLFAGKTLPQTSRRQKMLSKSSLNPEAWIFMLQEYWLKCVDFNGSYFD